MPVLKINGVPYEVETGKRLVLAIEENGIGIGHRCGGWARCTTCRVEFEEGEPETMTVAEYERLKSADLLGKVRLACQIVCDHDMAVKPLITAADRPDWEGNTGSTPEAEVTPEAAWFPISELKAKSEQ